MDRIRGNPAPGDLELAHALVPTGETILAIFRAPAAMVNLQMRFLCATTLIYLAAVGGLALLAYSSISDVTVLDVMGMIGLGLIPILMCSSRHLRALRATRRIMYVVGDRVLYMTNGQNTASLPLYQIGSVHIGGGGESTFAEVCFPCLAAKVVITVPESSGWANAHLDSAWCNGHCMQWQRLGERRTKRVLYVDDADEVRGIIDEARQGLLSTGQASAVPPAPSASGPVERIAGLKALLDSGAISQTEYDEKKASLLALV